MELISIIISVATSIFSGIVLFFIKRYFDNKEKIEIEEEKARQKENVLILKSIDAIGRLTYADSIAIRDGKINGEMKDAVQSYIKMKKVDWIKKLTSRKFWVTVAGFVAGIIIAFKGSSEIAESVSGCIMAGASVIAYIFGEGLADASNTSEIEEKTK